MLAAGGGGRAPVVLLPGLGAPGYLVDTLHGCAASAPSYLLDVPGFGERGPLVCEPELSAMTDVVTGWLSDALDRPAVLFGHSTAAQIVLAVAVRRPELAEALVLAGPTFPPRLRRLGPLALAFLRDVVHESPAALPGTVPAYLRAGPARLLRFIRSAQRDEPERLMPQVRCPVRVVRGRHDTISPSGWAQSLADAAPRGSLVTVPGPHTFPATSGGLTARLITAAGDRASER
ncbi:Pimeloyl-ACP methyl ester carboxylesterase [Amycolatopsis australiensis]|uniref:Pimeloyl-ACP methyl ester carboxylesterase n=1 Tax=Amycolatopsis australiensis TaxID=546364 RepID=A0A1K1RFN0_9PSEU|nr:Pimeloyl-ACP methyl ester carboxylesterase [Amycolatopsis australiensis]